MTLDDSTIDPADLAELDLSKASAARVYDYWLGGANNFAVDREVGDKIVAAVPGVPAAALANRSFLRRSVQWCLANGIDQFLDLGSGIPTVGNVHEVAQGGNPYARVAYVDSEPVAVAHSRNLLRENATTTILQADLRNVDEVCAAHEVAGLLDFDRPIALLTLLVLQYFPGTEHTAELVRRYWEKLPAGSVHILSHVTDDEPAIDGGEAARLSQAMATPTYARTHAEVRTLLGDAPLVDPGLVFAQQWRPEASNFEPQHSCVYTAIARIGTE
ncbi:SAM-dependent methyltransferase [Saccharopolyspora endophytica]|uniref:SAM-dependent methyltransferase n=1 Tax=Saccharopolyspora endophytica TaxID=543886 RepID=A0ABS5DGU8_9PSEU|nr:SAM-dependent methyltransferase [Saccharopolyspora endophytica]MBQ0925512.1 SAM-dependent methyltransferase [Saccharopolyspora endophytica]